MTVINTTQPVPGSIPVLIVGAGPVGLSLAIELRLHAIEVIVIEQDLEIVDGHPKGRSNDLRTLEHYRRWGVSDELRKFSWQPPSPNQQLVVTESLVRRPLGAYPLLYGRHVDESQDLAAEPSLSVPQPITTRILQNRAIQLGVSIFRGWKAVSIRQDVDCAMGELQSPGGTLHSVAARYIVGCDGPSSLVRKTAGIKQKGRGPIGREMSYVVRSEGYRIADMISTPAHDALGMLLVLNSRVSSLISIPGEENWGFGITVPNEGSDPTEDDIQSAGQDILGAKVKLEIVSRSSYNVFTRVSESYKAGRLFIAGDAAHLCPPTGGHNMNVGIGDAVNLGWKLAAVLKSWGGERLLDSYDTERRPVGEQVSQSAMENSYSMRKVAEAFKGLPPLEQSADGEQRFQRGQLAYDMSYPQWNIIGVALDQRYDASSIVLNDGWGSAPFDGTTYWPHACPGHRAPHLWLPDGSPLLDHFSSEFTLLDVEGEEEEVLRIITAARRVGMPLKRLELSTAVARTKYPAEITIIRPDQYIAWQGNECKDAVFVIDRIRGM